jgi:hypothetical protein
VTAPDNRPRLNTGWSRVWAVALIVGVLTQLVGWIFRIPSAMLSHHVGARMHQGIAVVAFALMAWLLWHWGPGRLRPAGWPDVAAILLGVALWYVSWRWPVPR